jgi:hypothetical protein
MKGKAMNRTNPHSMIEALSADELRALMKLIIKWDGFVPHIRFDAPEEIMRFLWRKYDKQCPITDAQKKEIRYLMRQTKWTNGEDWLIEIALGYNGKRDVPSRKYKIRNLNQLEAQAVIEDLNGLLERETKEESGSD